MIPHLRTWFNEHFTAEKYQRYLKELDRCCGTHVKFRNSETPIFLPKTLIDKMARYGQELVLQIVDNQDYRDVSKKAIPSGYYLPAEPSRPLFIQADFGLVRTEHEDYEPKLVEIQGFPSLYAYQAILAPLQMEVYGLDPRLSCLPGGLLGDQYLHLLRRAIVGNHHPENVILMEINPHGQKTLPDFILTERLLNVPTVNVVDIIKIRNRLFYPRQGKWIPIERIYNRVIVDDLVRSGTQLPFRFDEDLDVEWAGHPNWFFKLSKFSIPFFKHPCVPRSWFLDQIDELPSDLENYVLKPLFSFAGLGVKIGVSEEDVAAIPPAERCDYILQEKVPFESPIETPYGPTKAEIRIMYIWLEEMLPVNTLVRMGRGKMMGVDHNQNMEWVGGTAAFYEDW